LKFDIPINITAVASTEAKAEQQVMEFMIKAFKEFANEYYLTDFQYFEFIAQESSDG
jgi:hypothetical protein